MQTERELLTEICERIDRHARGDMHTRIDGLLLSKAAGSSRPDYTVTEPLLVVMARAASASWSATRSTNTAPVRC